MTRLLHDRYYAYADAHAWDLATGATVRVDEIPDVRQTDPPTRADTSNAAPSALVELLDHGREGEPRCVVVDAGPSSTIARVECVAIAARERGFIPVAAELFLHLREFLREELEHRALLLIVRPTVSTRTARAALVEASSRSSRPHILLSFADAEASTSKAIDRVHEARANYGVDVVRRMLPAPLSDEIARHVARAAKADEFVRAGRHASAERLLRDVGGALVRRQAFTDAAQVLIALGRLVLERGRALDADRVFDEAAGHALTGRNDALSFGGRVWQAAARTDAGQLTAAESLCRAAILTNTLPAGERSRAEATLARILVWQGRIDEAAECDLAVRGDHEESACFVGATAVRVLLARGVIFEAGQRARRVLTLFEHDSKALLRVVALTAHLRVLAASGDTAAVDARMIDLARAVREARTPLRLVRARLLVAQMLRALGETQRADDLVAQLRRVRPVVTPLLKEAIDGRVVPDTRRFAQQAAGSGGPAAIAMVTLAHEKESDRGAISGILEFVAQSMQTSRIDLCSADAGPTTVVLSLGSGTPTELGPRVLEAGITIDSGGSLGGELGVPIRMGPRLIAALVARWPVDRRRPVHAEDLLELAAAIAAPRIDAMRAAARETAIASVAIPELVGVSGAIADVRRAVARAAAAPFAVLIEGESGVGKELVARAIHQLSARRERRFCDLNCAALPDELLESELFGHARGAFTGAVAERAGLIEEADGGTLFLDEVADLSPRAQAKLLRVLQQQEVRRVGESFSRKVDVRVVSAANRDVHAEAAAARFRSDLVYRLDVIRIRVPPLRERPEDIPVLAHHLWSQVAPRVDTRAVLTHGLMTALAQYHWPGNVRELQNVMAALAVAAPARGQVRASLLPHAMAGPAIPASARLADARRQFERRFIEAALTRAGGRRARAARELGLSRQGLLKIMTRLRIEPPLSSAPQPSSSSDSRFP